jgi:uncharacterized membrane protein
MIVALDAAVVALHGPYLGRCPAPSEWIAFDPSHPPKENPVNVALWIVQVLLALSFFGAGYDQAVLYDDARRRMAWVGALTRDQAIVLGVLEILGAVGLILPAATGVLPWLTAVAAVALALLMALAASFHIRRHEIPQLAFSGFFGIVAALVAIGRIFVSPF